MDWTAGYTSDIQYTAGFYREQSPAFLNFTCILNGYEPNALKQKFSYFELGFGRGITINALAASNPNGQFYAADFNPAHVAGARQLAGNAKLDNLQLLENSFAELAEGLVENLPQFDFITLHGIYTWVTAENRQAIVKFLARYLKPGGIVYVSYNALPGWCSVLPLQRLLVEHADLHPDRSDTQISAASDFIGQLEQAQAGYFQANPALKSRLDILKNGNRHYLVHEYMHKHWEPMYHVDVARDLKNSKLDYIGSADLPFIYPNIFFTEEKLAIINSVSDTSLRETVKDYFLNTSFRKDVFIRGPRRLSPIRQIELLEEVRVTLIIPREEMHLNMKFGIGECNGKSSIYLPVFDALAVKPHSLKELSKLPELAGQSILNLAQIVAFLTASGQVAIYFESAQNAMSSYAAHRMNYEFSRESRYSDEIQVLASPLLGSALPATMIERMIYFTLTENPSMRLSEIAEKVCAILAAQGRRLTREVNGVVTESANPEQMSEVVMQILSRKMPIWKQLQML